MYCTLDDLRKRMTEKDLVYATSDGTNSDVVNQQTFDRVVQQVCNEIDTELGGRYTVPFTNIPETIRDIAIDMVEYYLRVNRLRNQDVIPEGTRMLIDKSRKLLLRIAEGKAVLNDVDLTTQDSSYDGYACVELSRSRFTDRVLKKYY